jgi:hypothetical protein
VTELRRLFDAQADDFALELLRSAEGDAPNPRSLSQTAAALGIGAAFAGTAIAPSAVASTVVAGTAGASLPAVPAAVSGAAALSLAVIAKPAAVGMIAGLVAMGGYYSAVGITSRAPEAPAASDAALQLAPKQAVALRTGASPRKPSEAALAAPASLGDGPAAAFAAEPTRAEVTTPSAAAPSRATGAKSVLHAAKPVHPAPAAAPEQPEAPVAEAPKPSTASQLSLEVELLDRAREALRGGNALGALSVLEGYRGGILAPEAQVLRIQALERSGQPRAASALARDFLAKRPGSRHAAALRSLAERVDAAP